MTVKTDFGIIKTPLFYKELEAQNPSTYKLQFEVVSKANNWSNAEKALVVVL